MNTAIKNEIFYLQFDLDSCSKDFMISWIFLHQKFFLDTSQFFYSVLVNDLFYIPSSSYYTDILVIIINCKKALGLAFILSFLIFF